MSPTAWGAIAALTIFAMSATFYAGYLTARVSALESWRLELRADFMQLMNGLHKIEVRLGVEDD